MMVIPFLVRWVNGLIAESCICTVDSALVDISTGGSKSATKYETVLIHAFPDCGMIYISRLHSMNVSSFEELFTKINERKDPCRLYRKLQLSSDSTRAERVDFNTLW